MSAAAINTFTPASHDSAAAIKRYQEGYRAAETVVRFSRTVKNGGVFAGGVVLVGGLVEFILNPIEHHGFPVAFAFLLAGAVLLTMISQFFGMELRGQGELLKAAIDSDVNSSPFLSNAQRASAMSLRKRPLIPKCIPVWTE